METTINQDPYGPLPSSDDPPLTEQERPRSRRIAEVTLVFNARRRFRLLTASRRGSLNREGLSRKSSGQFGSGRKTYISPGKFAYLLLRKIREQNAPEVKAARKEGFPDMDALYLAKLMQDRNTEQLAFLGDASGVCRSLKVDKAVGVKEDDIERRRRAFGSNAPERKVMRGFWSFVWDAMQDFTLLILAICAIVSVILGLTAGDSSSEGWSDGLGIAFSIVLVVMVTALSDYKQSLKFANLEREKEKVFIDVMRGGKRKKVLTAELVVGDIVLLGVGDQVPADGLLLVSNKLVVDESSLTGESEHSRKDARQKPYVFGGTMIMEGTGTMLVAAVGMNTEWGNAMSLVDTTVCEQTPLQEELDRLVSKIGQIGASVAVIVLVISFVRYVWWKQPLGFSQWGSTQWLDVLQIFAVSVTIVVVAVPEGLPLAVTLTLAYSMDRMIQDRALVRHLSACETMGSATTICSDKTGTLTSNKMTVVDAWMCGSSCGNVQACVQNMSATTKDLVIEGIAFNTSGDVIMPDDSNAPPSSSTVIGSPTEAAILSFGLQMNGRFTELKKKHKLLAVEPFSSEQKKMGAAVKSTRGEVCVHWKGASEIVLQMCDSIRMPDESVIGLDDALRRQIKDVVSRMTERSLRTIGFAYKNIEPRGCPWDLQQAEDMDWKLPHDDLTFLGVLGLQDPPRPGVAKAVETCEKAGITVRMVTGDNLGTARAVAKQCGIWKPGDLCVEGPVFRKWTNEQKQASVGDIKVMARSSPADKLTLVQFLKERGDIVAVTGDGTNDAPALYEAHIGLAMGIVGTEVAKESAGIIILDDNFVTVVNVAKWGRAVYSNIQKFLQFQLTVNLVALSLNFITSVVNGSAPLTTVQLLWVNLIMDTLGALALATEPPSDDLMEKKALGRKAQIISGPMWANILSQWIVQLAILIVLFFRGKDVLYEIHISNVSDETMNTIIFNIFVLFQLFNLVNSRNMEKVWVLGRLFTNWVFLGIMAFITIFQIVLVQVLGQFASTVPLSPKEWGICIAIAFVSVPVAVISKLSYQAWASKHVTTSPTRRTVRSESHSSGSEYQPLLGEPDDSAPKSQA